VASTSPAGTFSADGLLILKCEYSDILRQQ